MRYLKNLIFLGLTLLSICGIWGCAQENLPLEEISPIEQEFINSFKTSHTLDYQITPNTKIVGKTFWVYVATDQEIVSLETQKTQTLPPKIIKFLDIECNFENSILDIGYIFLKYKPEEYSLFEDKKGDKKNRDILKDRSLAGKEIYPESTDRLREIFNKTYYTIGDIIGDADNIDFFAICIADIKRGVKTTYVIHKLDLEKSLLRMLPDEEFGNRLFRRNLKDPEIKNDLYGLHINYIDISLIDFLINQIKSQAYYKVYEMQMYEAKKLTALDDLDEIILKSVYDRAVNYEFYSFYLVEIENLVTKTKSSISKSHLLKKFNENPQGGYPSGNTLDQEQ